MGERVNGMEKLKIDLYKVRLHTAGKTSEQILKTYEGLKPSDEVVQGIIKAFNLIDGLGVVVSNSFYGKDTYTLIIWNKSDDDKFKEFSYLLEQDPFCGTYVNDREQFEKDWDSEQYEPPGSLSFLTSDIEIMEKIPHKEG
jgi:hypothetical protein